MLIQGTVWELEDRSFTNDDGKPVKMLSVKLRIGDTRQIEAFNLVGDQLAALTGGRDLKLDDPITIDARDLKFKIRSLTFNDQKGGDKK